MGKNWRVYEFLAECEKLCWDQYGYDYSDMPEGICNGHTVGLYRGAWHSIIIDGCVYTMSAYSNEHPNGCATWQVDGKEMTALEYVQHKLSQPLKG